MNITTQTTAGNGNDPLDENSCVFSGVNVLYNIRGYFHVES